jgi:hypothetical protein
MFLWSSSASRTSAGRSQFLGCLSRSSEGLDFKRFFPN